MEVKLLSLVIVFATLVLLGIFLSAVIFFRKKKYPVDYYSLFVMGIIWLPFGLIIKNNIFTVLGLVFLLTGLMHKKDWKKNRKTFSKMDKFEKRITIAILIIGLLFLALGILVYFLLQKGII